MDGRRWRSTAPEWAGHELVAALGATTVTVAGQRGNVICEHARAYGDAPTDACDPASQLPPLANGLGAWHEGRARAALPEDLRARMDSLERVDPGAAVRCLGDGCASSGWEATVGAARGSLAATGAIDPAAASLAAARSRTGEVTYDEPVDLGEYDRLTGAVANGRDWQVVARRRAQGQRP